MDVWEDDDDIKEEEQGEEGRKNGHEEKMYDYEKMNAGLS